MSFSLCTRKRLKYFDFVLTCIKKLQEYTAIDKFQMLIFQFIYLYKTKIKNYNI